MLGDQRPAITSTSGRKTSSPPTHTQYQFCHWPGVTLAAVWTCASSLACAWRKPISEVILGSFDTAVRSFTPTSAMALDRSAGGMAVFGYLASSVKMAWWASTIDTLGSDLMMAWAFWPIAPYCTSGVVEETT